MHGEGHEESKEGRAIQGPGLVERVSGKVGPKPSVALTRGRYTLPHNNLYPFEPALGPFSRTHRKEKEG